MTETSQVIDGVDPAAWERWVSYRKAIKKPIKPASMGAMQLKLLRLSKDPAVQAKIIDASIENQWQGLFELKPDKPEPGKPKAKSLEEQTRDALRSSYLETQCERQWEKRIEQPLGKLKLASALLARYDCREDQSDISLADAREYLKQRVAEQLRIESPAAVLGDPELWSMVLRLFGEGGIRRLEARAKTP